MAHQLTWHLNVSDALQGFLYVLDHKGETQEGWPIQMGEIQGQVIFLAVFLLGGPLLVIHEYLYR